MPNDIDWKRQLADNALRCQALSHRVAGISITETSQDGIVRVTVSASGVLTDLVLTERRQVPLSHVGAQIMECITRAQARIPDLVRQAMLETVGVRDAGAQLILDDTRQRFPDVPQQGVRAGFPAPAPSRPHVTRQRDDEDWYEGSILEAVEGGP